MTLVVPVDVAVMMLGRHGALTRRLSESWDLPQETAAQVASRLQLAAYVTERQEAEERAMGFHPALTRIADWIEIAVAAGAAIRAGEDA